MNEKMIKLGERTFGLVRMFYPVGLVAAVHLGHNFITSEPVPAGIDKMLVGLGLPLAIDGAGDLITGKHHYVATKIFNYINERRNIRYLL